MNKMTNPEEQTVLTELETKVLRCIPHDCFFENGRSSMIWTDCFLDDCTVEPKKARAILITLQTKGFVKCSGGRDGIIRLTWKGINKLAIIGDERTQKNMLTESYDDRSIPGNKEDI